MAGRGRKDKGLRVVVLTEDEHRLACHIIKSGLEAGWLANGHTRLLLATLEAAREAPTRRRSAGWLSRWRAS